MTTREFRRDPKNFWFKRSSRKSRDSTVITTQARTSRRRWRRIALRPKKLPHHIATLLKPFSSATSTTHSWQCYGDRSGTTYGRRHGREAHWSPKVQTWIAIRRISTPESQYENRKCSALSVIFALSLYCKLRDNVTPPKKRRLPATSLLHIITIDVYCIDI